MKDGLKSGWAKWGRGQRRGGFLALWSQASQKSIFLFAVLASLMASCCAVRAIGEYNLTCNSNQCKNPFSVQRTCQKPTLISYEHILQCSDSLELDGIWYVGAIQCTDGHTCLLYARLIALARTLPTTFIFTWIENQRPQYPSYYLCLTCMRNSHRKVREWHYFDWRAREIMHSGIFSVFNLSRSPAREQGFFPLFENTIWL